MPPTFETVQSRESLPEKAISWGMKGTKKKEGQVGEVSEVSDGLFFRLGYC